jgi:hypothetical protein
MVQFVVFVLAHCLVEREFGPFLLDATVKYNLKRDCKLIDRPVTVGNFASRTGFIALVIHRFINNGLFLLKLKIEAVDETGRELMKRPLLLNINSV